MERKSSDKKILFRYYQQIVLLTFVSKYGATITVEKRKLSPRVPSALRVKKIVFNKDDIIFEDTNYFNTDISPGNRRDLQEYMKKFMLKILLDICKDLGFSFENKHFTQSKSKQEISSHIPNLKQITYDKSHTINRNEIEILGQFLSEKIYLQAQSKKITKITYHDVQEKFFKQLNELQSLEVSSNLLQFIQHIDKSMEKSKTNNIQYQKKITDLIQKYKKYFYEPSEQHQQVQSFQHTKNQFVNQNQLVFYPQLVQWNYGNQLIQQNYCPNYSQSNDLSSQMSYISKPEDFTNQLTDSSTGMMINTNTNINININTINNNDINVNTIQIKKENDDENDCECDDKDK